MQYKYFTNYHRNPSRYFTTTPSTGPAGVVWIARSAMHQVVDFHMQPAFRTVGRGDHDGPGIPHECHAGRIFCCSNVFQEH